MLKFVHGNLLDSTAHALVNTVNCRGVMGKGIALGFKRRFPKMFRDYVKRCKAGEVKPGRPYIYVNDGRQIINFPTKDDWRRSSRLEYIEHGLDELRRSISIWHVRSLALPALGCGNGGLDWRDVKPLIIQYLADLEISVEVFEPSAPHRASTDEALRFQPGCMLAQIDRSDLVSDSIVFWDSTASFHVSGEHDVYMPTDESLPSIAMGASHPDQQVLFGTTSMHQSADQAEPLAQSSFIVWTSAEVASIHTIGDAEGSGRRKVLLDDGSSLLLHRRDEKFIRALREGDRLEVCFVTTDRHDYQEVEALKALVVRAKDGIATYASGIPGSLAKPVKRRLK